ncbi:MAG: twin-arginine translocation signal domain-containing protein [Candidatus Doudnabacteria bacterium]|nr:twin-arginine translocation signal domain-containing protein [Candidatus Doudnabacteria bacterium]
MPERFSEAVERHFTAPEAGRPKQPGRRDFLKLAGLTAASLAAETIAFRGEAQAGQGKTVSLEGMKPRESRERAREFSIKITGLVEPAAGELVQELAALVGAEARQLGRAPRADAPEFTLAFQNVAITEKQSTLRREAAEEVGRQANRIPSNPQVFDNTTYIGRAANGVIGVWARSKKQQGQKQAEQTIAPLEGEARMQYQVTVGKEVKQGQAILHYHKVDQEIVPAELELAANVRVSVPDTAFRDQNGALQAFIAQHLVRAASGLESFVLSDAVREYALHNSEVTERSVQDIPRKRPRPE